MIIDLFKSLKWKISVLVVYTIDNFSLILVYWINFWLDIYQGIAGEIVFLSIYGILECASM